MTFEEKLLKARTYVRVAVGRILWPRHTGAIDDVIQEASLKAWSHRREFREDCAFNSWFYRIAMNEALIYVRRHQGKRNVPGHSTSLSGAHDWIPDHRIGPEERVLSMEFNRHLVEIILGLPRSQRQELLRFATSEKGDPAGISSQAKGRRFHGVSKLRQAMAEGRL